MVGVDDLASYNIEAVSPGKCSAKSGIHSYTSNLFIVLNKWNYFSLRLFIKDTFKFTTICHDEFCMTYSDNSHVFSLISTANITIGDKLEGYIRQVKIWDKALTPTQLLEEKVQ